MPLEDERVRVKSLLHMREIEEMRFVVEDWIRHTMQPLIDVHPVGIVNRHRRP